MSNKTIAVDLDGVCHSYTKSWQGGIIYDEPVQGAKEGLTELKRLGYRVAIFTTRTNPMYRRKGDPEQHQQIVDYMAKHELPYDEIYVGPGKIMAEVYIDDRAISFKGDWQHTIREVQKFKVWNKEVGAKSSSELWKPDEDTEVVGNTK